MERRTGGNKGNSADARTCREPGGARPRSGPGNWRRPRRRREARRPGSPKNRRRSAPIFAKLPLHFWPSGGTSVRSSGRDWGMNLREPLHNLCRRRIGLEPLGSDFARANAARRDDRTGDTHEVLEEQAGGGSATDRRRHERLQTAAVHDDGRPEGRFQQWLAEKPQPRSGHRCRRTPTRGIPGRRPSILPSARSAT